MKTHFSGFVRFLSVLCLTVWAVALQVTAQTPLGLSLEMKAGQAQLTVTGAVGTACQIQWTDNLSSTSRWFHLVHRVLTSLPSPLTDSTASSATRRYYRAVWTPSTNLAWISPGTFTMGSPTNEVDRSDDEGPQTVVTISRGFWMGKYEVTQGEYLALIGSNPSCFTSINGYSDDLTRPVEKVAWHAATNYCGLLTQGERAAGRIPTNCAYRLPTEAEWEYACRAGTTTRFSYGDDPGYSNLTNYAWYGEPYSTGTTHPVGLKLPNPWGLYDMHGNVWECCQDGYGPYAGGSAIDPPGPAMSSYRVMRGGSWYLDRYCRSALRIYALPDDRFNNAGFRLVLAPCQP
jgi:formylglycine-generating enzyme required for sulfatase activity